MRLPALLVVSLFVVATVAAQDDVLAIERQNDMRGHRAAVQLLHEQRVTFAAEGLQPKDLCRYLTAATGAKLDFQCATAVSDAAPALDLNLRGTSLWSLMSIVQIETGLRFVYRFGLVWLVAADAVKPLTHLVVYDLRAECTPLRNFPGPDLGLGLSRGDRPLFPEPTESGTTVSGFTADGIETLLLETVRPESWALDGVKLSNHNGLFLIRQTPQGHDEIELTLVKLGLMSPGRRLARRMLR